MKTLLTICSLLFLGIGETEAQYQTLLNFDGTNGHAPYNCTLTHVGNRFYGMTDSGGAYNIGCIFSIDSTGSNYKDILDFSGVNGQWPLGSLTFANGLLYGTTSQGGVWGEGNIFSIDTNGSKYDNLFDIAGYQGIGPDGNLLVSGSKIFGVAPYGGAYDNGVIFSMDTSGYNYKVLFSFHDSVSGEYPWSNNFTLIGHRLYGVVPDGGKHATGLIYSIDTNGSDFKILDDSTVYAPLSGLVLSRNKFYGSAYNSIFSIDTNGKGCKILFTFNGHNGLYAEGLLTLLGNRLYGTTGEGGLIGQGLYNQGYGVIFSIDTNGTGFRDMYQFNGTYGAYPWAGLTALGNRLYGMTQMGGGDNMGTIFSIDTGAIFNAVDAIAERNETVTIYPNPSKGVFTLALTQDMPGVKTLEIYNVLGQNIFTKTITTQTNLVDISNRQAGVYLYRLLSTDGNLISSGKLIIQ